MCLCISSCLGGIVLGNEWLQGRVCICSVQIHRYFYKYFPSAWLNSRRQSLRAAGTAMFVSMAASLACELPEVIHILMLWVATVPDTSPDPEKVTNVVCRRDQPDQRVQASRISSQFRILPRILTFEIHTNHCPLPPKPPLGNFTCVAQPWGLLLFLSSLATSLSQSQFSLPQGGQVSTPLGLEKSLNETCQTQVQTFKSSTGAAML